MRGTWVFLPLWVKGKKQASTKSKKKYGGSYKVGKVNFSRK